MQVLDVHLRRRQWQQWFGAAVKPVTYGSGAVTDEHQMRARLPERHRADNESNDLSSNM